MVFLCKAGCGNTDSCWSLSMQSFVAGTAGVYPKIVTAVRCSKTQQLRGQKRIIGEQTRREVLHLGVQNIAITVAPPPYQILEGSSVSDLLVFM